MPKTTDLFFGKHFWLLSIIFTMFLHVYPSSSYATCLPWNRCFYDGAFDFFKQMSDSAQSVGNAALKGDIDGVAHSVIQQLTNAGPFSDAMFTLIADVTPRQASQYVNSANNLRGRIEQEANGMRAQTYRNMYGTFKNDATVLTKKLQDRDFNFSEYYRYSFYYAVATADWSNPSAMRASATRIAEDQYAAYSWAQAHTVKGAAIGTARNRVGLTDQAIKDGVRALAEEIKANKELGKMGAIILSQFASIASSARNEVLGATRTTCAQVFGHPSNINVCMQRCLPGLHSSEANVLACATATSKVINTCRGKFSDPSNQDVCLTRCRFAKTDKDLSLCSSAAAPIINACRSSYVETTNQDVCIKRCMNGDDDNCVRDAAAVINRCANLFSAPTNINYCKDHCAEVPLTHLERCRKHAATMINTGRREPFLP